MTQAERREFMGDCGQNRCGYTGYGFAEKEKARR